MNDDVQPAFGRRRSELPEDGLVTMKLKVPARVARLMRRQSAIERRTLSGIASVALSEYFDRHPEESWTQAT
ncbi:hypothetical protein BJF89_10305 [Corynebacterium sp. CNJ-954]|uniref:hypothetical protein n=1 Tax=Corynebacterium sp. CNJ-954 TaxID=1904962 RepID=UPI0009629ED2|nr:hypothetical protein [Corynebacterium sp. CNJ-954]OLT50297.1 hypothetical protein BJF89_10305 [Corynebacterium sp. CNJ-954]